MDDTLNMLKPYANKDLCKLTYEELACIYQTNHNEEVLASSYINIHKLVDTIALKYYTIDDTDKQSYCLEKLDYCLRTYNSNKDKNFVSYFCTCYKNMLNDIVKGFNYMKRSSILESLDSIVETGIEDTYDVLSMLLPTNLTYKERVYCELASQGYDNTYIASYLDVSRMTICKIRKSLKIKLNGLQTL